MESRKNNQYPQVRIQDHHPSSFRWILGQIRFSKIHNIARATICLPHISWHPLGHILFHTQVIRICSQKETKLKLQSQPTCWKNLENWPKWIRMLKKAKHLQSINFLEENSLSLQITFAQSASLTIKKRLKMLWHFWSAISENAPS